MKKFIVSIIVLALLASGSFFWWSQAPILPEGHAPVAFAVKPGSGTRSAAQQIVAAGVPVQPYLLELLARFTGSSARIKAGSYEIKGGVTPQGLLQQLVRGEFAQHALTIVEGWTFAQMRQVINAHAALSHDTTSLSDEALMARISPDFKSPEGLFFPDTYLFAKGSSDLAVYRQAHALMLARLDEAWQRRLPGLPYKTPYEALIMASIVEKETGLHAERDMIASVFVNRLRIGMMLQTDPTVIYGMGQQFQGNLRRRDLQTDTPYNTYTRGGLPPTPIALPGAAALRAALNPAQSDMLYFVSRGNGSSQFSRNLDDHNRAVNQFQRGGGKAPPAASATK